MAFGFLVANRADSSGHLEARASQGLGVGETGWETYSCLERRYAAFGLECTEGPRPPQSSCSFSRGPERRLGLRDFSRRSPHF